MDLAGAIDTNSRGRSPRDSVIYPESDHMGESGLQKWVCELMMGLLRSFFAETEDRPMLVGGNQFFYLRDLGPDKERAASYALGAARAVLAAGGELVLCTAEVAGPTVGRVRSPIEAGRRLARAVAAEPGMPPDGWPVAEIGR